MHEPHAYDAEGQAIAFLNIEPQTGPRASFYSIVVQRSKAPEQLKKDIAYLLTLLQHGKIKPHINAVVPFHEIGEAHRLLEGGSVKGKLVLAKTDTDQHTNNTSA